MKAIHSRPHICSKQCVSKPLIKRTRCTRRDCRLRLNHAVAAEWRERVEKAHSSRRSGGFHPPLIQAADPLRRRRGVRGRLHRDHLPPAVWLWKPWCDGGGFPVVNDEAPAALPPRPTAASCLTPLLLSSPWHENDLCQAAFFIHGDVCVLIKYQMKI